MNAVGDRPTMSVILPVHNMQATVGGQLAALARQDFTGCWELAVADNCSSDGTIEIVRRWQDRLPLRIVAAPRRPDTGYARNVAVAAAEGELLAFCDADDEVRPDWLRLMVSALQRNPLVAGRLEHGRFNSHALAATYARDGFGGPWWRFLPAAPTSNLGVRRGVFDDVGGFPEECYRAADAAFCWRVQIAGYELTFEPAAAVDKRVNTPGWWQLFRVHVRDGVGVVRLYREFRQFGMPRSPLRDLIYDWVGIPFWMATGAQYRVARVAGRRVGRLIGSIRWRVLCP